jgi:hypothetical protein
MEHARPSTFKYSRLGLRPILETMTLARCAF